MGHKAILLIERLLMGNVIDPLCAQRVDAWQGPFGAIRVTDCATATDPRSFIVRRVESALDATVAMLAAGAMRPSAALHPPPVVCQFGPGERRKLLALDDKWFGLEAAQNRRSSTVGPIRESSGRRLRPLPRIVVVSPWRSPSGSVGVRPGERSGFSPFRGSGISGHILVFATQGNWSILAFCRMHRFLDREHRRDEHSSGQRTFYSG
ncbi:uncharacterized protein KD926_009446 [Aspergillus affinis]|uniref:uncharacterized protein n=1 Tax=Aspergillus affinis TaxID=1070780 RepID=UPI0022FF2ADC|nr:uncharacterized protein KD926_009446 [Aspergillus affinis]KAI9039432.1 hypothetical protein KD926_009446 [Aspergillus affinis]